MVVDVTESDLETMCKDGEMTSTWTMTLFTLYMEYSLPTEVTERFTIVDPLWVQLHKQTTKGQDILQKVAERDFIFILIVVQGHCVLWTKTQQKVSKMASKVVFYDPLHILHIPTQPNGWDCGFYVMKTIQMLVEEFLRGWISPDFVSVIANGCLMWIL